ncbi:cyclodeaminase/cyclohydrolase family protein [Paramaledivibacter caminithermalis]|jgi:formiminotetrahydrofolate cyclodeaminase|uniref:Formiminotetrahydrofolate cyclodeaminase n=1 Tax=Paramaledivibacter caminithermalis (strain DSM 15212 / CIP 107654 / DViRD3) TaxID=1121301 RepID=A0A1M6STK1_PARC5|nr:cyclodeaminase/cyclohydrolase family protein [Paramaledivibacter caminithermalis]SHK47898.1 formiminotetrahydrofolate cyclodeaminase [Paramaledivibacter caminithermalis DSM 15212]
MLGDKTIKDFLEETASKSPVPGGGSIAAMSAGVATALTEMVANLTIGKKGYEDIQEEMVEIASILPNIRESFIEDIDRDAESFNRVMDAFKMPKNTDEEKKERKNAIQDSMKNAALIPLEVAQKAFDTMQHISKVVEKGNKNAVTDGAVAAMMARTAVLSALFNVKINLSSIKDEEFVKMVSGKVKKLEIEINNLEKDILSKVDL